MADLSNKGDLEVRIRDSSGNEATVSAAGALSVSASVPATASGTLVNSGDAVSLESEGRTLVHYSFINTGAAGGTIQAEYSTDNATWFSAPSFVGNTTTPSLSTGTSTATASLQVRTALVMGRYFRIRATTAPTSNITITLYGADANPTMTHVSSAQSGTWTVQPGNTANSTAWLANSAVRDNAFASLVNAMPDTTAKEIRMDDIAAGDLYIGRNTDGTSTATASWEVVRIYRDSATGATTRIRFRTGVAWDSRTSGWT